MFLAFLMYVGVLFACTYVHTVSVESGEGVGAPGTRVMDCCEPSCGHWNLNPSSLQEQQVLLAPISLELKF